MFKENAQFHQSYSALKDVDYLTMIELNPLNQVYKVADANYKALELLAQILSLPIRQNSGKQREVLISEYQAIINEFPPFTFDAKTVRSDLIGYLEIVKHDQALLKAVGQTLIKLLWNVPLADDESLPADTFSIERLAQKYRTLIRPHERPDVVKKLTRIRMRANRSR